MSGSTTFSGQEAPKSGAVTYDGGIAYRDIDVINVMLGQGNDNFTVTGTVPNTITMIQGGGGDNTITATGGGGYNSPLLLFASTTQNGSYYDATTASISAYIEAVEQGTTLPSVLPMAYEFTDLPTGSAHSVLDASLDANSVIMYGGAGSTYIYGGGNGDQIAGGSGNDEIYAGSGNDLIHGDDGFNVNLTSPLAEIIADNLSALIVTHDPSPTDSPTGDPLLPTSDQIYAGLGHDIIFLDHGVVDQLNDPITGTGGVLDAYTTDPIAFGLSAVYGSAGGTAIVLAGSGRRRSTSATRTSRTSSSRTATCTSAPRTAGSSTCRRSAARIRGPAATTRSPSAMGTTSSSPAPGSTPSPAATGTRSCSATTASRDGVGGVLSEIVSQDPQRVVEQHARQHDHARQRQRHHLRRLRRERDHGSAAATTSSPAPTLSSSSPTACRRASRACS